jgi:hypothetical protein
MEAAIDSIESADARFRLTQLISNEPGSPLIHREQSAIHQRFQREPQPSGPNRAPQPW